MDFSRLPMKHNARNEELHLPSSFPFPVPFRALVNATWIDRMIKQRRSNPSKIPRSRTCSKTNKNQVFQKAEKSLGYQIRSSDRREKTRLPRGGYLFWCKKTVCAPVCPEKCCVHVQSRAMHTSVRTAFGDIRGVD
jgi:hypothetical protein